MAVKTSSSSLRTLNGLFDLPKMNHRRDFLRENKLNLKELQRTTANKLMQTKHEKERKLQQLHPKFPKQQEQHVTRRSASKHKVVSENKDGLKGEMQHQSNQQPTRRSYSFHKAAASTKLANNCHDNDKCCLNPASSVKCPRNGSATSASSKFEACDKSIQTEDICDEEFLYEALKKCSLGDFKDNNVCQQHADENDTPSQLEYNYNGNNNEHRNENLKSTKSYPGLEGSTQLSHLLHNGYAQKSPEPFPAEENNNLSAQMPTINIDQNIVPKLEELSSGRSRQTACSQVSKKKYTGSVQKLGSRDSIRLPRYLQKEKREKEEERLKKLSRDINCPFGHYALTEEERVTALNNAEQKMSSLVQELNHMPMTTETLRIRNRKMEIEKELTKIEFDIRLYSKPKVYVPLPVD
uniref:Enkurin domain-containing protein n=1 Tax=Glossina morsitans morsitans TaxID=37546 RepID=A0A1B0G1H7_GLOMM